MQTLDDLRLFKAKSSAQDNCAKDDLMATKSDAHSVANGINYVFYFCEKLVSMFNILHFHPSISTLTGCCVVLIYTDLENPLEQH